MRRSSVVLLALCTLISEPKLFWLAEPKVKRLSLESLSAAARFALNRFMDESGMNWRRKSALTSKRGARSTLITLPRMTDSTTTGIGTRLWTMRSVTLMGKSTPTDSKTSGACSSADSREPTSTWNHSTCSAIWTNKFSGTTIAPRRTTSLAMETDFKWLCVILLAVASPIKNSLAKAPIQYTTKRQGRGHRKAD